MPEVATELAAETTIPVIDFAGYLSGEPASKAGTAARIRGAFEEFGFLYLRGHGLPSRILDDVFAQSCAFFDLPPETKARASGYSPPGYSALDPTRPADLKEAFRARYDRELSPTHWPAELAGFAAAVEGFHLAGADLARQVMHAIALSLGLAEDYFDAAHAPHCGQTHLLHYPPLRAPAGPGQFRSGAHTDYGTLTLLFHHADAGGLEIQRPDETWVPAPSLPGAVIVNAADLLARWTNDQFRSVRHRVVLPEGALATRSRYSAVRFCEPRYDAVITCLPTCQGPGRPARYPPITAGEHIQAKLRESRRYAD
jgi:isopenicillin N synthase-like dioxygenase